MAMVYVNNNPGDVHLYNKREKLYVIAANGGTLTVSGPDAAYFRNFAEGTNGAPRIISIDTDDSTVAVGTGRIGESPVAASHLLEDGTTYDDDPPSGGYDANEIDLLDLIESTTKTLVITHESGGAESVLVKLDDDDDLIYTLDAGDTLIFTDADGNFSTVAFDNNQSGSADTRVNISALASF